MESAYNKEEISILDAYENGQLKLKTPSKKRLNRSKPRQIGLSKKISEIQSTCIITIKEPQKRRPEDLILDP
jgi:hypothetical protein